MLIQVVTRRSWWVGIDAAIVAQHEVCIRATDAQGRVRTDRLAHTGRVAITEQPAGRDAGWWWWRSRRR